MLSYWGNLFTPKIAWLPALLRDDQSAIKIFEGGSTNIAILPPHTDKVVNIPLELHLGLVNAQNVLEATSSSVTLNGNSGNLRVTTPLFPTGVFGEVSDASHPYKNAFDGDLDTTWKPSGCSSCGIIFTGIDRYSTVSSLRITCSRSSCPAWIAVYGSSALDPPAHNGAWALVNTGHCSDAVLCRRKSNSDHSFRKCCGLQALQNSHSEYIPLRQLWQSVKFLCYLQWGHFRLMCTQKGSLELDKC